MAVIVSPSPAIGFTLTLPNAATVVAVDDVTYGADAQAPPSNCKSINIYNMSTATEKVFVRFCFPAASGLTSISNSTVVPPGASITFDVGVIGQREQLGSTKILNLYLRLDSGNNINVNVTYLMGRGDAG